MSEKIAKLQGLVLGVVRAKKAYGATDEEIEKALSLRHQSASARRRELVLKNLVVDSGGTRIGGGGRRVTVWVARQEPKKKP